MTKEVHEYVEGVLRLLIEKFPNSNPYHRFWIEPKTNRFALDIFIGNQVQSIGFEQDEEVFEHPEDLVETIIVDLKKAGYEW